MVNTILSLLQEIQQSKSGILNLLSLSKYFNLLNLNFLPLNSYSSQQEHKVQKAKTSEMKKKKCCLIKIFSFLNSFFWQDLDNDLPTTARIYEFYVTRPL